MMSDEFESAGVAAPDPQRGSAVSLHLTVADVDALCARIVAAGTTLDRGPEDSPPAGRVAVFRDPFGHRWFLNQPAYGGLMSRPVIVIVGAGPGVSGSVARRFAREGYDVGLLGIDEEQLVELAGELEALGAAVGRTVVDVTDVEATTAAIQRFGGFADRIDVLHFNPSAFREKDPLELTVAELLEDVALGVGALLTAVQAARPFMSAGGRVTVTGSMAADKPWNRAASLGVQKAGVRNLVHSLDTTLEPDGIRAVSVTVRGTLGARGCVHPGPRRRRDLGGGAPGRGRLADRGALLRMKPVDTARATVEDVHELALAMPHVQVVRRHARENPVYQVGGKSFVFFRNPRPDAFDPETGERYDDVIVFWVASEADKEALVQDESTPFFTTPHFNGHPSVLLRGSRIGELTRAELAEVVQDAWLVPRALEAARERLARPAQPATRRPSRVSPRRSRGRAARRRSPGRGRRRG